jgi:predicted protein tyrosine phosphatase
LSSDNAFNAAIWLVTKDGLSGQLPTDILVVVLVAVTSLMVETEVAVTDSLTQKSNILFICSKNQWRSPTAENIWRKHPELNLRSAGKSQKARKTVSSNDIQWADIIFVMEEKHKNRLKDDFSRLLSHKVIHVLDIPDEYQYMDPHLIKELGSAVGSLLD